MHKVHGLALLAAAALVACSSKDPVYEYVDEPTDAGGFARDGSTYDSSPPRGSGLGQLRFQPTQSYSGFDGTHAFKVPVAVYDAAADLKVTVSDPSAAAINSVALANPTNADGLIDDGKYFMVTAKRAGTITLTAASGGKTTTTTIAVTAYAPDRWTTGQARYTAGAAGGPACADCHVSGQAIDHSPAALATSDDTKVAAVITTGISTAGFPIQGVTGGHRWNVTDAQRDGLVAYLRALEPRGFK